MAIAAGKDGITKDTFFDAVKRYCRMSMVGFEPFLVRAEFENEAELGRNYVMMSKDLGEAFKSFAGFAESLASFCRQSGYELRSLSHDSTEAKLKTPMGGLTITMRKHHQR